MKSRIPICYLASIGCATIYGLCTTLAYLQYPGPFSPTRNWLSDLGNQTANPRGAPLYNVGVLLTSVVLAAWFAGLSQWRLTQNTAQQRLLAISQTTGILATFALMMSALHPINEWDVHVLWSRIHFITFGVAFAFSVTALRYHRGFSKGIPYLGIAASGLPFLMFTLGQGQAYWMEWLAVAAFLLYTLTVGRVARSLPDPVG